MEGGYLPWKNKSKDVVDQLEAISKPLPAPPTGTVWEKEASGDWLLKEKGLTRDESIEATSLTDEGGVREHIVMPEDTLQGLCLRYGCSAVEVRRLNMFSGNSIQFKKTLLIPVTPGKVYVPQEHTKDVTLQKFQNATGECISESRVYLEDANYDFDVALQNWRKDENWEEGQYLDQIKRDMLSCSNSVDSHVNRHGCSSKKVVFSSMDGSRIVAPAAIRTPIVTAPDSVHVVEMTDCKHSIV